MSTQRIQHLVPSTVILVLAATVAFLSFTREPAAAFLFPRLVSVVMLSLALWNFLRAARGLSKVGTGINAAQLKAILPGLVVLAVFIFFAAKYLGFYVASFAAFFVMFSIYDPDSHASVKVWGKRIVITFLFMLVIYGLFSMLLKVQTPRGLFF